MRTIAITSFHPLISRNILATPLLEELTRDPEVRISLLVPEYKRAFFEREFGGPRVDICGVSFRPSAADIFMLDLALAALASRSMAIRRYWEFLGRRAYFGLALKTALAASMAGRAWAAGLVRWLDAAVGSRSGFRDVLGERRPDLVFATDVQHETDLACLRAARDLGIASVGMTRSWDNPTSKGLLRHLPDTLVAQNGIIASELTRLHRVPPERIRVVGVPHYDRYLGYRPRPRTEFFRSVGFDPAGRLLLFTPIGLRHVRENIADREILKLLVQARAAGELTPDLQVLVRLPPTIAVDLSGFAPPAWMKIEQPGIPFGAPALKDSELDAEDDRHLMDSLAWSNVVLTGPSSIVIDAAVFDRPTVLVDLENAGRGYWGSIACWYDYDHFQPILRAQGARRVASAGELITALASALAHPQAGRAGRARITREQLWRLDGQSSARLAVVLGEQTRMRARGYHRLT